MRKSYTHDADRQYGCFPELTDGRLIQAVFDRHGGVSPAPWNSLNVGRGLGDAPENVSRNRALIKKRLRLRRQIFLGQVHGDRVAVVDHFPDHDRELPGYDAVVTDLSGIGLVIQQADCQAVMLFDPERPAVGIVHAGWRGSVAGIIGQTVAVMRRIYDSDPAGMRAAISPSLGPCCAELIHYHTELPPRFHDYQVRPGHFDFWRISRDQLRDAGLSGQRIYTAGICTVCNPAFFSYRREKNCGRSASIIALGPRKTENCAQLRRKNEQQNT